MKINRITFIENLEKVYPAVSSNTLVPEFQCFRLNNSQVQVTDGSTVITTCLEEDLGIVCSVPATPLLHLLKTIKEKEIELVLEEDTLSVKTKKLKGKFSICKENSFDVFTSEEGSLEVVDKQLINSFIDGLSFCRYGVATATDIPVFCGIMIQDNILYSTNRTRILKYTMIGSLGWTSTVPLKFSEILIKNKSKVVKLVNSKDTYFLALLSDGTEMIVPFLIGDHPALSDCFPDEELKHLQLNFSESFNDLLDRHSGFLRNTEELCKEISISVSKDICVFKTDDADLGNLEEEVTLKAPVEIDFSFAINPTLFKDVLQNLLSFKYYIDNNLILLDGQFCQVLLFAK